MGLIFVSGLFTQSSKPIISPWFTADMDKLCVAVVAKLFVNLNITIENMTDDRFELGNIVTYRQVSDVMTYIILKYFHISEKIM